MLQSVVSILSVVAILLSAYGIGRPILRRLRVCEDDRLTVAVWSMAVGLVVAGGLLACLGMVRAYYVPVIGILSAAACFWGLGEILSDTIHRCEQQVLPEVRKPSWFEPQEAAPWAAPPRWLARLMFVAAALACLGSLTAAMAPPTNGDALCGQLEVPKAMLACHGLEYFADSDHSTAPLLVEMWYLWALALDTGVAAQLVHWALGVLLILATVVLATPLVGRSWAWIAGGLTALVPGVSHEMSVPLDGAALALLCTLALAGWWRAAVEGESRRWFVLAGIAAGGALGTRYLAFLFAAALTLNTLWIGSRQAERRRLLWEGTAIITILALSLGGFWYVRSAWHRGNPFYPLFQEVLNCETAVQRGLPVLSDSALPLGRNPVTLVTAAWKVTMHPECYGGKQYALGTLFLAMLPGVFLSRRLRGLGILMAVAGTYWFLWFLLCQDVRSLLPIVPVLSLMSLWVLLEMRRLPVGPRWLAGAAIAGSLAGCCAVGAMECRDRVAVACGWESREDYLSRCEPTWQAARLVNRLAQPGDRILSQERRAFYFDCPLTQEDVYRRRTGYEKEVTDPLEFGRQMRGLGFTYLLLAENYGSEGIQYDPTLSQLADSQWDAGANDSLMTLCDYEFEDADGGMRHYRLVMLK